VSEFSVFETIQAAVVHSDPTHTVRVFDEGPDHPARKTVLFFNSRERSLLVNDQPSGRPNPKPSLADLH
jgi:hypothetical protein